MSRLISLSLNGVEESVEVETRETLADVLRNRLGFTGTHVGCASGVCGACTVLLDGISVRSCLLLAVQVDGVHVETVEGLTAGPRLHPIQEAFRQYHALQCGFCTPGFLMTALELLRENADPSACEIREAIGGNLCRCTGYVNIVRAIRAAACLLADTDPT
jgi:carbon-monoxide dehydrogenase small subunit